MARGLPTSIRVWRLILRVNMTVGALTAIAAMVLITALQPDGLIALVGLAFAAGGAIHAWVSASALHRLHWRWVVNCEE
ncbi:hypothetical protein P7B02_04365 [Caulobacter segnis]|uniref:hypothetical protein n=1 Tax=Caulobacter segnis TaxID=88688 RepID=UPI00240F9353|nr:hypothetical protein [Caulobacter segnis]MDG2520768.1 hypothetical protein [Caulobacter segnis]